MSDLTISNEHKLVDANGLLDALFESSCRPSFRWLRQMQAQRKIPYIKIGHLVRFDVKAVKLALAERCTINPRASIRMR